MLTFNASYEDLTLIDAIANRAQQHASYSLWIYPKLDAVIDVLACHCNSIPLRLLDLLEAPPEAFILEVYGIRKNLNHETGKLDNGFVPSFAQQAPGNDNHANKRSAH